MKTSQAIRVLITDDHPIVREGLAAIIDRREDMTTVAQAGNGQEALEMFRLHHPDVVLMDLRMPQMDGVTAITQIRQEAPDARIIVLTTFDGEEDIYRGLQAGRESLSAQGCAPRGACWKRFVPCIAAKRAFLPMSP